MAEINFLSTETILRLEGVLLQNLRRQLPQLRELLQRINDHSYEDRMYRFYYQSFKVYSLQSDTKQIAEALAALAPEGQPFSKFFQEIIRAGTGHQFKMEDNQHWLERTAPIVQAFLHGRYFLEMAVKYGEELQEAPQMLPSGWAALLCLYGIR